MMHTFEINWQRRQQHILQAGTITMPEQIADVAWIIITEWNRDGLGSDLRYVRARMFSLG
jgi:negative regulator of replication initiation